MPDCSKEMMAALSQPGKDTVVRGVRVSRVKVARFERRHCLKKSFSEHDPPLATASLETPEPSSLQETTQSHEGRGQTRPAAYNTIEGEFVEKCRSSSDETFSDILERYAILRVVGYSVLCLFLC